MGANTFGNLFKITTFGESHGPAMGVVIDGCPAGVVFDNELIKSNLARRRPGQSSITTSRDEKDEFKILSGVFEGKTLGSPITLVVENTNQKSSDYDEIKKSPRQGHADDLWKSKFTHVDHRGGG
ncbi:chorismate synthase, partial [bacterium]|nr:chorismate synthase [bacterium]